MIKWSSPNTEVEGVWIEVGSGDTEKSRDRESQPLGASR